MIGLENVSVHRPQDQVFRLAPIILALVGRETTRFDWPREHFFVGRDTTRCNWPREHGVSFGREVSFDGLREKKRAHCSGCEDARLLP